MTIPLSSTRITVTRSTGADQGTLDPYDSPAPAIETVATGVRARVSEPTADTKLSGGQRVVWTARLVADPTDIRAGDTVTDSEGTVWTVLWASERTGIGLDHTSAGLRMTEGAD
jgi:hypothetical protein